MKKWIKLGVVCLLITSTALISLSYAKQVWFGDLRDYYPFGLYIQTRKLDYAPVNYTIIENDTYIEQAIASGNLTWVQADNLNSTFVSQGFPEVILWVPEGNYYRLDHIHLDGTPESWKFLPPPPEAAQLLTIPWFIFAVVCVVASRTQKKNSNAR
jgi:hypothetical protein